MRVKHLPRECKIEESKVGIMLLLCSTLGIHLIEKLVARVYFPFFRIQDVISTRDWMVANNSKCLLSRHRHFVYLREGWAIKRNYLYNSTDFVHNCLAVEIFFYLYDISSIRYVSSWQRNSIVSAMPIDFTHQFPFPERLT